MATWASVLGRARAAEWLCGGQQTSRGSSRAVYRPGASVFPSAKRDGGNRTHLTGSKAKVGNMRVGSGQSLPED